MDILEEFIDLISNVKDFINNAISFLTDIFSFLPSDIFSIFLSILAIAVGVFIYRLVK